MRANVLVLLLFGASVVMGAEKIIFRDDFGGKVGEGWSWLRENPAAWRVTNNSLQVRIEPGNMWGGQKSGKNTLLRDAPDPSGREIEVSVVVSNNPTGQYEQVDLVWYYADSHMVKIGFERVFGTNSIVMGREENDRTRTIAVIPIDATRVELRHRVKDNRIRGQYRASGTEKWRDAGECDLPVHGAPKISLQCYQGLPDVEHWAVIEQFTVKEIGGSN